MKNLKLGTQLNISFGLVLFIPMIIATAFSILYYSNKIEKEAVSRISSDLKIARIIYTNMENKMKQLAVAYSQRRSIVWLLDPSLQLGRKIGLELAASAIRDGLDTITIVDSQYNVLIRSHAPERIGDRVPGKDYIKKALKGASVAGTELLSRGELYSEGVSLDEENGEYLMAVTGVAPIYDRNTETIVAALIVRRFLDENAEILKQISNEVNVNAALYENARMLSFITSTEGGTGFSPPPVEIIREALIRNTEVSYAHIAEGGSISKVAPVRDFSGKPVGALLVQAGIDTYLNTRNIAILNLLGIFLVGILLAFIIKTIVVRRILFPVKRLITGINTIGNGNYHERLEVTSGDEIGELTNAFNQMGRELEQYDTKLKEYNLQLEERVKERTRELETANQQLVRANSVLEETLETLNPGVSKLIGNNKQQLGLVYATEMVTDVCNYTKLNMILGETMMGEFMKRFFRESHKLLAQYRGLFDKTVGDQIVAIFGTPKDQYQASPIHPFDAVACALQMVEAANRINLELQSAIQDNYSAVVNRHKSLSKEDRESIRIEDLKFQCRIGINTSNPTSDREIDRMRMVMMGAETCVDYTAQGGAVIYAFRLESTGYPGHVHVGENTRRIIEHVYMLEELPAITLKGLGVQKGYRVVDKHSVFDNIYPKTIMYRQYSKNFPQVILQLIHCMHVGRVVILEVRKINQYIEVDIPYLEHLAGYYHLGLARSLFCYAVGNYVGLSRERLDAMAFASLWHNAVQMVNMAVDSIELYPPEEQVPAEIDKNLCLEILEDIADAAKGLQESEIIQVCNQFDQNVFERTYLKMGTREVYPAKKVIADMKQEAMFDPVYLAALEALFVLEKETEDTKDVSRTEKDFDFPGDTGELVRALKNRYSHEELYQLLEKLKPGEQEQDLPEMEK